MTVDVRATHPHEYRRAANAMAIALLTPPPSDETWARVEGSWHDGRSYSAWDGDQCVGHAAHYPVEMVVPGGARVSTAAVARVGVLPSHRRMSIGARLMRAVITDAAESGCVVSGLHASEGTIYGRFGYGIGSRQASIEIDAERARPVGGMPAAGSMRLLAGDEIVDTIGPLFERVGLRRAGAITRPRRWIERVLRPAIESTSASFVAVHERTAGISDGFVHYSVSWADKQEPWVRATGQLHDLFGADDRVETALWDYLLGIDLVTRWTAIARPVDDLGRIVIPDQRAMHTTMLEDEQWIRILDVDAFFGARTYRPASGSVVVGITDSLVERNNGSWRIDADGASPTADEPDLRCDIASLSALSLGGNSWRTLAGAGAVLALDDDSLDIADVLFGTARAPFCGTYY